ncbi:hypothetical protein [Devosia sp. CAU 1758]
MTIKSALSVVALAAGLVAVPAMGQTSTMPTMIGTQTVSDVDAGAVKARCEQLQLAESTDSLSGTRTPPDSTDSIDDGDENDTNDDQGTGDVSEDDVTTSEPEADGATALHVDLDIVTLAECEADGWLDAM